MNTSPGMGRGKSSMPREQLLLLGCSTRCEPFCASSPTPNPPPQKTNHAALTAPGKAGAGKIREKSFVPPKSAIKQLLSSRSCAALQGHPVQSQKVLIGLKTPLFLPPHQEVSHHPPFFYILPHLDVPPTTERSEMHLIKPEKSRREAFFPKIQVQRKLINGAAAP